MLERAARDEENLDTLRSKVARREALLGEREREVDGVRSALEAFRVRYRQEVGLLHDELDELELAIAEAELGELSRKLEGGPGHAADPSPAARPAPPPRYTSDAVRKLFRDVAKAIHPDLARDDVTRDRLHSLMVEANRAYRLGDEQQLRWILQAWERSPEAVRESDAEAARLRLVRRIAQIEERLDVLASDLAVVHGSPLWTLKTMVDEAAARGKDIVGDMVARLKRDIMVATNRLEAMRPPQ